MGLRYNQNIKCITQIKEALYKCGPVSRSQLSELLSLTPPTITTNVSQMIHDGFIRELSDADTDTDSKSVGRKPIIIDFEPNARFAIGMELGPYLTTISISNLKGDPVYHKKYPIASTVYSEMIDEAAAWISDSITESGISRTLILGVGVGTPGFVKSSKGVIRSSYRSDWNGRALAGDLMQRINLPVVLENNVRLRAIGANLLDTEIKADTFAYFYAAKGIACPLVIRGGVISGRTAGAGEIGHMVMDVNGRRCDVCGNYGCLETFAGENAILSRCRKIMSCQPGSFLKLLVSDPDELTMSHVLKAQAAGDIEICRIMNEAIAYLGVAIANIINFISPSLFLIDAYMMKPEANRNQLLSDIQRNLYGLNSAEVEIRFLDFDVFRSADGGCALVLKTYFVNQ